MHNIKQGLALNKWVFDRVISIIFHKDPLKLEVKVKWVPEGPRYEAPGGADVEIHDGRSDENVKDCQDPREGRNDPVDTATWKKETNIFIWL